MTNKSRILVFLSLLYFSISSTSCQPPAEFDVELSLAVCDDQDCRISEIDNGSFQSDRLRLLVDNHSQSRLDIEWYREGWQWPLKEDMARDSGEFWLIRPDFGWVEGWYEVRVLSGEYTLTRKIFVSGNDKKHLIYNKYQEWSEFDKNNNDNLTVELLGGEQMEPDKDLSPIFSPYNKTGTGDKNSMSDNWEICTNLDGESCEFINQFFINEDQYIFVSSTSDLSDQNIYLFWEGLDGGGELLAASTGDVNGILFKLENVSWPSGVYWLEVREDDRLTDLKIWQVLPSDRLIAANQTDGFYNNLGYWLLADGSGFIDDYGNKYSWQEKWGRDYIEAGWFDEYGNYVLNDGSGFYDKFGDFWFWREMYGDGKYIEDGDFEVGDGYVNVEGNYQNF